MMMYLKYLADDERLDTTAFEERDLVGVPEVGIATVFHNGTTSTKFDCVASQELQLRPCRATNITRRVE